MDDSDFLEKGYFENVKFGNSDYTLNYVLDKLTENGVLNQDQNFSKIQIKEIGLGQGFCSRVFRIKLEFEEKSLNFIAKVSTHERWAVDFKCGKDVQIDTKELMRKMHDCECQAYKLLSLIKDFPTPYTYYIEKSSEKFPGLILMEDMSIKNRIMDGFESANSQQLFDLAEKIANLQVQFSFLPNKIDWIKRLSLFNIQTSADMNHFWMQNIKSGLEIKDPNVQNKIQKFLTYDLQKINKFALQECSETTNSNTICRGELWAGNVMLNNEDETKIGALIDFQTTMYGNPLYDLCCFIVLCSNVDARIECERRVIDFYYDKLCLEYAKHGMEPNFSRRQAHQYYDYVLLHTAGHQIQIFSTQALSLQHSESDKEKQKFKILFDRLCMSLTDSDWVMNKYKLEDKFK